MKTIIAALALFASMLSSIPAEETAAATPTPATPTELVKYVQAELIATMKEGDKLSIRQRYEHLKPIIEATHDMDAVAKVVLSRSWADLTEDQRKAFTDKFAQLNMATYAANFSGYSGEEFKILSEEAVKEKQALVRTELITKGGAEKHTLDYQVGLTPKGWRVLNIIADGVSDLALKRSEYASVISKDGFDALLKKIEQKTEETFNGPPSQH